MIHPLGVIIDASADNCTADPIRRYKFNQMVYLTCLILLPLLPLITAFGLYISERPLPSLVELASSVMSVVINGAPVVVLMACAFLLNKRILKDLQRCANVIDALQDELVACRNENSELLSKLAEAEARAESYREKIPKELLELEDAIKEMLELNSSQDTSSGR